LGHAIIETNNTLNEVNGIDQPNTLTYAVQIQDAGKTVQYILQNKLHLSRTLIRELKGSGKICRNGTPVFSNQLVLSGDKVTITWQIPTQQIIASPIPLSIVYEDDDLLVIDKPWNMLAHPVGQFQTNTVANAVIHHFNCTASKASFHPVNRLDRNTSGLMLIAKHKWIHQQLNDLNCKNKLHKQYVAVVYGNVPDDSGVITAPIARLPGSIISRYVADGGQKAITHYRVIERFEHGTLVSITLETGRTHQIRVHFMHIGHPLIGDTLYGDSSELITRQALHAERLSFPHPRTKEQVDCHAPLPDDIKALISTLKSD